MNFGLQAAAAGAEVPVAKLVHGKRKTGGKQDKGAMDLGGAAAKKPIAKKRKAAGS